MSKLGRNPLLQSASPHSPVSLAPEMERLQSQTSATPHAKTREHQRRDQALSSSHEETVDQETFSSLRELVLKDIPAALLLWGIKRWADSERGQPS